MNFADAISLFADALNGGPDAAVPVTAVTQDHLGFYRGNVQANRSSALQSAFPIARELVGETYFEALALAYIAVEPSASGNLHDDGAGFADFVEHFAPAQDLPWLPDVVRLDWAMHRAHFAVDIPPADLTPLHTLNPDHFGQLAVTLHPAVAVVRSTQWPIHAIYGMHLGGPAAQLDAGGQSVLVTRDEVQLVAEDAALLISTLQTGATVDQACERLWQHTPDFDPGPALSLLFGAGLVTALHLP